MSKKKKNKMIPLDGRIDAAKKARQITNHIKRQTGQLSKNGKYSTTVAHAMCSEIMDEMKNKDGDKCGMFLVSGEIDGRAQSYGVGNGNAIVASFVSLIMADKGLKQLFDAITAEYNSRLANMPELNGETDDETADIAELIDDDE